MGELWNKAIVTVYIRHSHYTKEFIDKNGYFTVNAFPNSYRKALAYIGSHSGRNEHKLSIVGQNPEFTAEGHPTFKEATLCIECKTIYTHKMELNEMPDVQKKVA